MFGALVAGLLGEFLVKDNDKIEAESNDNIEFGNGLGSPLKTGKEENKVIIEMQGKKSDESQGDNQKADVENFEEAQDPQKQQVEVPNVDVAGE